MRSAFVAIALVLTGVGSGAQSLGRPASADNRLANERYKNGWQMLAGEQWDQAAREFQAAIELNDIFKLAYYGLGRASMGGKHFADAIHAYEKCRDLYEAQASQNFANKGEAERIVADDVMQIDMTINRLQSGNVTPAVSAQIAQLNMQKQRLQNRLRNNDTLSLTSPVPPFVLLALGSAYFRSERFADAEQAYRQAAEGDPKYGEAHSNLAALYLTIGRYADANREVAAAEKAGYKVNPGLKDDIRKKKGT